jgi:hypothetical protein
VSREASLFRELTRRGVARVRLWVAGHLLRLVAVTCWASRLMFDIEDSLERLRQALLQNHQSALDSLRLAAHRVDQLQGRVPRPLSRRAP